MADPTDTAPPTNDADPPVNAARAVRLAEIQARADAATKGPWEKHGVAVRSLGKMRKVIPVPGDPWERPTHVVDAHLIADAEFIAHARTDVPWLLDEVRCLTGERDRARDVAVALEQENAEAWRQRNRLFRACEWYAVPESVIREACTPRVGAVDADRTETGAVWTLTTWLWGDPAEGFGYGYASQEAAERNGRMFATAKGAQRWRVTSPVGVVVAEWERRD